MRPEDTGRHARRSSAAAGARPADPSIDAVLASIARLRTGLPHLAGRTVRIAAGFSGGCDSMLLLDSLARVAECCNVALSAVHVHHGLSPNADAWAEFCAAQCHTRSVPLAVVRVDVDRSPGTSLEAAARKARFTAFGAIDADAVALAHHADDQAETLLLQLLRGAGPHGLSAMGATRSPASGPMLLRPWLTLPRATLVAVARSRGLAWIDDESNANRDIRRNFLRVEVVPLLRNVFPGYPATLVRAAAHQADAALLLDEIAVQDAQDALGNDPVDGPTLDRGCLARLAERSPARAANVLRWFLRLHDLRAPSTARLTEMLAQLAAAAADARVAIAHEGLVIGVHRGAIHAHPSDPTWTRAGWDGESTLRLPHGEVVARPVRGAGIDVRLLASAGTVIQVRSGGEHISLAPDAPARSITHLMQNLGIPHWRRRCWPVVLIGGQLAAVPGIGVEARFAASGDAEGRVFEWLPRGGRG